MANFPLLSRTASAVCGEGCGRRTGEGASTLLCCTPSQSPGLPRACRRNSCTSENRSRRSRPRQRPSIFQRGDHRPSRRSRVHFGQPNKAPLGAFRLRNWRREGSRWGETVFRVDRTAAGVKKVKTYQIAIGNGRHYGGGVVVHSNATIHDGMLDLRSFRRSGSLPSCLLPFSAANTEAG